MGAVRAGIARPYGLRGGTFARAKVPKARQRGLTPGLRGGDPGPPRGTSRYHPRETRGGGLYMGDWS